MGDKDSIGFGPSGFEKERNEYSFIEMLKILFTITSEYELCAGLKSFLSQNSLKKLLKSETTSRNEL